MEVSLDFASAGVAEKRIQRPITPVYILGYKRPRVRCHWKGATSAADTTAYGDEIGLGVYSANEVR